MNYLHAHNNCIMAASDNVFDLCSTYVSVQNVCKNNDSMSCIAFIYCVEKPTISRVHVTHCLPLLNSATNFLLSLSLRVLGNATLVRL